MAKIVLKNVSVDFPLFGKSAKSLKSSVIGAVVGGRFSQSSSLTSITALNSINLELNDGDRVGLVGHNGAGKSTFLRVLAGIYKPTTGSFYSEGRVVSLIDQSAGLNPIATGVENIFLRGLTLGGTKKELSERVNEIREFTGLGEFLDLPINIYSTGMMARLNFAISTCLQPEILIVDEGIGAGDAEFQSKAQERINGVMGNSKIVVIASHSEDIINSYCNKILTFDKGSIVNTEIRN